MFSSNNALIFSALQLANLHRQHRKRSGFSVEQKHERFLIYRCYLTQSSPVLVVRCLTVNRSYRIIAKHVPIINQQNHIQDMRKWAPYLVCLCLLQLGDHSVAAKSLFGRTPLTTTTPSPPSTTTTSTAQTPSVATKCDPCPAGVRCVPPIQCPAVVRTPLPDRPQLCDLPSGTHGYCCTSGANHTGEWRFYSS